MSNPNLNAPEVPNDDVSPSPVSTPSRDDYFAQHLKKKKRTGIWKGIGLGVLLMAGGAAGYLGLTDYGRKLTHDTVTTIGTIKTINENPNLIFQQANSQHVNILLIGRDTNWEIVFDKRGRPIAHRQVEKDDARSDTMILISLDKNNNKIRMVSLPRDARVHLPDNKFGVRRAKLNAAHAYGGPELLMQTLHDELGITVHHYAVIRFDGFKKLIDEVGGVYVDVIGALKRDGSRGDLNYDDNWGNLHIHLKPGKQWLNGEQAHNYVRFRMDIEGDPGRIRRQQSLMRALAQRLKQLPIWKIPPVLKEIRQQFKTDMDDAQLGSAAMFAKDLGSSAQVQPITLFGVYGTRGSLILNKPKNELLLQTIFGSTFNPDNFLQNSPSTEGDEIAPDFKNSPETQELLREAGILKGGAGHRIANANSVEHSTVTTVDSPLPLSVEGSSMPIVESPSVTEEERPRRRRKRRKVREQTERTDSGTRLDSGTEVADSPPPIPDDSTGVTDSPVPQPESSDTSAPTGDLSVESPVPQPER